ncbi:BH0509 family protein [Bacillus sp. FJAT-25509]|uniref:BH0509 family protein n=1 Tax=Bacillus sp. FJAT-25509 TaxID=1712029 RepID=UPI0012E16079|nr:BH0509 family protein [Bacillus sp. FJAT-25509]
MLLIIRREERKNMVQFFELTNGFSLEDLVFMTNADLKHLFDTAYTYMLHHAE